MGKKTHLVLIDPQKDFCNPGSGVGDPERGALYVDNAENDTTRIAAFINRYGEKIDEIHVTLDCHHLIDVAHPPMWRNSDGQHPNPFTIITADSIKQGEWTPIDIRLKARFIDYCESLAKGGRYPLCIWPPHCLIGTPGNTVFPVLQEALLNWVEKYHRNIDWVSKGSNMFTEHYSAVKAEVEDPTDPTTQLNTKLIKTLMSAQRIIIGGEAGSHCVKSTIEDTADGFGDDSYVKKMVLLTDGTSPVISPDIDFPSIQAKFIEAMKKRGMQTAKTTDF